MHCNQPYCGNGFSNGQCGYSPFHPPPQNSCAYPDVVGEGEVTSVTLPDGTVQFFFIPTIKWWVPQPTTNSPYYSNMVNTSQNNNYGSNIGAWFIRTITNPRTPQLNANPSFPRCEVSRPVYSSEYNLNTCNAGYQVKFHNDKWTSTTHLQYFYPRVREYDCSFSLPSKGCAAVQVDTTNTVCHYEVVCPKTCGCMIKPCCCLQKKCDNDLCKPRSVMSLVDTKTKSQDGICEYSLPSLNRKNQNVGDCCNDTKFQILPSDSRMKRIMLERKHKAKSQDAICQSNCSIDKPKKPNSCCGTIKSDISMSCNKTEKKACQPKDVVCECNPPACTDKSMATYSDMGIGNNPCATVVIQCDRDAATFEALPELWYPKSKSAEKKFKCVSPKDISNDSCCSCCYGDTDDENNI